MKGFKKRLLGILVATIMLCVGTSTTAFAAEAEQPIIGKCYNLEVTSEGITSITDEDGNEVSSVSPRSSISAYNQRTLTSGSSGIQVFVDVSGWGGMGVTVNASSSWNGYMSMNMLGEDGSIPLEGRAVYSNGETKFNNLWHYTPNYYVFTFGGIPSGQSVHVQIWIYG